MSRTHRYSPEAVEQAIASHNRNPRGGRIGRQEARLIHALLRGREPLPTKN